MDLQKGGKDMSLKSYSVIVRILEDKYTNENTVIIPNKIYSELNNKSKINMKVGALRMETDCSPNSTEDTIFVSQELADKLSLYNGINVNLLVKENELCLGPVIGTFTDSTSVRIASENRPGNKIKSLSIANKDANAILYFFSVDDFNYEENKIRGTFYNYVKERWEQRIFPLPDVLYDRGGGSLKSQKAESEHIRGIIENNSNVKKFNPMYIFDKWEIYRDLKDYEDMVQYLPLTIRYRSPEDLLKMFRRSSILYIKDRKGNRGLGVLRVIKYSNGAYELSYFKNELFKYIYHSFNDLVNKIDEEFKNKKAIIQCAIDVIKINNGNVDMRATVQRDGNGELGITAYPVRVGKESAPITSTRSGSEVYRFDKFFEKYFKYNPEQIQNLMSRVDKFLLTSYKRIEEVYGTFGEIGIDFAIDTKGGIYFIECNAKPGKDTVYLSYDENTVKKAFLNPLEYAKYLSGF
jgi:hypothetical protein